MTTSGRRTKIVCTLGPSSDTPDTISSLVAAGMDVARLNMSHATHDWAFRTAQTVRDAARAAGRVVAVLVDLQGPRVRVGTLPQGFIELRTGAKAALISGGSSRAEAIPVEEVDLSRDLAPGDSVLLDDGSIELSVERVRPDGVECTVVVGGRLTSHKGLNVPGASLSVPSITSKDLRDLELALGLGADYIAMSFVRSAEDLREMRQHMARLGRQLPIIAKIEKHEAVSAFPEILDACDGVMVARGDLGVELPPEQVPLQQKRIIALANQVGKPAITATQMLDSMTRNPRPTRAEVADVANAVLDGTDATMLSGESAAGSYPVEAVRTMARIVQEAETLLPYRPRIEGVGKTPVDTTSSISEATCEIADELGARAIVTATSSGHTARMVARHRPRVPIYAATPNPETQCRLAVVWGVSAHLVDHYSTTDEMIARAIEVLMDAGLVSRGDLVVITAGSPPGISGRTNLVKVHHVGED